MASFVPSFFEHLVAHFQSAERQRMLSSLAVTVAPELWLSCESAAFLDVHRELFGLAGLLDEQQNVPRWLIAAERRKVDLWVQDQWEEMPSVAVEFKVLHNNGGFYDKIWEIRRDLGKKISQAPDEDSIERWGVAMLVFSNFYSDQKGNFHRKSGLKSPEDQLRAFAAGLQDGDAWYEGAAQLELVGQPVSICDLSRAHYIDSSAGQPASKVHFALLRRRG